MPPLRTAIVALLVVGAFTSGAVAADSGAQFTVLNPDDLRPGDTAQTIHLAGESLTEPTTLVVDLTPLVDAGADLSNASASVQRTSSSVDATVGLNRSGDGARLRVRLDPSTTPTDFRAHVRLRGVDTAAAEPGVLRYDATVDGRAVETDSFRLNDPPSPELSRVMDPEDLLVGEGAATQRTRLILLDVPANATTVTVDLSPLSRANASLRNATVETSVALPDRGVAVRSVERRGATVTLVLVADARQDRVAVRLAVSGIDTRAATPTTGLRYPITAGSTTVESEAFGLYRPGETPTSTPTPVESGTATPDPTPTPTAAPSPTVSSTDGDGPGFGVVASLVALTLGLVGASRRID